MWSCRRGSTAPGRTEDSGTTDAHGDVRLQLNPYCADGAWCTRAFDYRLLVDGRRATIRVTFGR